MGAALLIAFETAATFFILQNAEGIAVPAFGESADGIAVESLSDERSRIGGGNIVGSRTDHVREFADLHRINFRRCLEIAVLQQSSIESDADVLEFYAETRSTPIIGALDFTEFRIRDTDSTDRLRFRGDFALGAGSDGIDPSTDLVAVKLSTPTGGQFYPALAANFNPLSGFDVRGRTPRRRWSLNDSERSRTGIERLHFDENPHQTGAIVLRDLRTSLPALDYSTVTVMIDIGVNLFTETIQLVERRAGSGQWHLPR